MIDTVTLPTTLYSFSQIAMAVGTAAYTAAVLLAHHNESAGKVPPEHYDWLRGDETVAH